MDFECGMMAAIRSELSGCSICGCYFHFVNAINRKLIMLNLKGTVLTNQQTFTIIKMFTSLAYLPESEINCAYTWLESVCLNNYQYLQRFCQYFRKQWIQGVPLSVWSVNMRTTLTTNNHAEGFNNKIKTNFGRVSHQSLSVYFSVIRNLIIETEIHLERVESGIEHAPVPTARHVSKTQLITSIQDNFSQGLINVPQFLCSVAQARSRYSRRTCCAIDELLLLPFGGDGSNSIAQTGEQSFSEPITYVPHVEEMIIEPENIIDLTPANVSNCGHMVQDLMEFLFSRGHLLRK